MIAALLFTAASLTTLTAATGAQCGPSCADDRHEDNSGHEGRDGASRRSSFGDSGGAFHAPDALSGNVLAGTLGGSDPQDALAQAANAASEARLGEFAQASYRFCHDPRYGQRGTVDHFYCAILDEDVRMLCPGVAKSCPWPKKGGWLDGATGRRPFTLPSLPRGLAQVLAILLVAAVVFLFVRALVKAGWTGEDKRAEPVVGEILELGLHALPEAMAAQLVGLAEKARVRGEHREATMLLHLAALRFIDDRGLARFHPSKTNGDYLRALRAQPAIAGLFRAVSLATERVRFGDGLLEAAALSENLARARALIVEGRTDAGVHRTRESGGMGDGGPLGPGSPAGPALNPRGPS